MFLVSIQRRHVAYCYEQKDFWYVKNISNDEWFNLKKEIEDVFHFITLNTEMVERGNVVCEFHYQQLRKRTNTWSCPPPSPSSTQSNTPITTRLEKVRFVIDQGHGGAQVFGKTSTKHLPRRPLTIKSQEKKRWIYWKAFISYCIF